MKKTLEIKLQIFSFSHSLALKKHKIFSLFHVCLLANIDNHKPEHKGYQICTTLLLNQFENMENMFVIDARRHEMLHCAARRGASEEREARL